MSSSNPSKKVAFILKGYPRVSETFIAQEIHLLEQRGFDIEIYSMRQPREPERQPIVAKIKAPVTYVPEYIGKEPWTLLVANCKVLIKRPQIYLPLFIKVLTKSLWQRNRSPIKRFIQASWLVAKQNLLERQLHLHSHFVHTPTEMTLYMSRLTGLKFSISAHAKDIYTIPKEEVIERVNASEFITTCTRFNYEFLQSLNLEDPRKVHLNYHGIDVETFSPSSQSALAQTEPYLFVSVGRLVEKKGYDIILRALQILKQEGISFQYDIYGAGDLHKKVQGWIKDHNLTDCVALHLTATHPEIISRLQKKGIFICGSKITENGDRDGIPNTVAEAMSMEVPVIATKVSGIPELIDSKESGFLIEARDSEQMAAGIKKLIENPELTDQMGRHGRQRVKEFFNADLRIEELKNLMDQAIQ